MRMIVPIAVTDSVMTGSNMPENDYPNWDNLTPYSIGDRVIYTVNHSIYECVEDVTVLPAPAPPNATTKWVRVGATNKWKAFDDVIQDRASRAGGISYQMAIPSKCDGIAMFNLDAESVRVRVIDPLDYRRNILLASEDFDNPEWEFYPFSTTTSYYIGNVEAPDGTMTARRIRLDQAERWRQVVEGAGVGTFTNSIYVRSNSGPTSISFLKPDNSTGPDTFVSIDSNWTRVQVTGYRDTGTANIGFFGLNFPAIEIDVWHPQMELGYTMTDYQGVDGSGAVTTYSYDVMRNLQDYSDINTYWDYFFDPIERLDSVVFTGVTAFSGSSVLIDIIKTGTARVGEIVLGQDLELGQIHAGASIGIEDYSRRERDVFGNVIIIQRAYSDKMNLNFSFNANSTAFIRRQLALRRSKPTVFHGGEGFEQYGLLVYGFYKDFSLPIVTQALCVASIEIEGLT